MYLKRIILPILSLLVLYGLTVAWTHAEVRRATDDDRDEIEAAGLKYAEGMLWDPSNPYVGIGSGEAKQYLRNVLCRGGSYGGAGPDGTIKELNPEFATCAAKFLKFAQQNGIPVCISEGYRTPQKQQQYVNEGKFACRYGAQCEHPRGIAIDVNTNSYGNYSWLHNNACQFGVDFYLRFRDAFHFVPLAHSISRGKATCRGGGQVSCFDPNFTPTNQGYGGLSPSSGITGAARDLLGQREQMCPLPGGGQVPCSSIANRGAQQPLAQGQQPQLQQAPALGTQNTTPYAPGTCPPQFYCANSTYYYRSSSCVDQVYQKCPAGCSASSNACASTTTTSSLSVIDQIGLIAEPTSTPTGAVSDLLFELSISGEDIATLQDKTTQGAPLPGDTSYGVAPPLSQQTFVSGDLRYSQAQYQPQLSALQRTLATMKDILLRALAYLRPFGRPAPVEGEYDEWAE